MDKHLLVAVSRDQTAQFGLRFLSTFFSDPSQVSLTLLNIRPKGPHVWAEEASYESKKQAEDVGAEETAKSKKALDQARQMLTGRGFDPEKVHIKLLTRQVSIAEDITRFAHKGLFDALVLGRYGADLLDKLVDASVEKDLLDREVDFPVWVCRGPCQGRRGVLLCLDGSESSLRMADHVAFMLAGEERHDLTMFNVVQPKGKNGRDPEAVFSRAEKFLVQEGMDPERIKREVGRGPNVAQAIMREAAKGYAAVAVGRTGSGKGLLGKLFMGSVSHKLLTGVTEAAFWFCR